MVNFGTKLTSLCGIVIIKTWLQLPEKKKELPGRAAQNKHYYCGVSVSVVAMHANNSVSSYFLSVSAFTLIHPN